MAYRTQGVVTFHTSTPKTISITPNTNYQVIHKGTKYAIFVEDHPVSNRSRNFSIHHRFEILDPSPSPLEPLLIQAAFNNVCLQIAINDDANPKVTEVSIPARS